MALGRHDSLLVLGGGGSGLLLGLGGGGDLLSLGGLSFSNSGNLNSHSGVLAVLALLLADGVLLTTSLLLGLDLSNADLLSLDLVDGLNQDVLVLELITLGAEVELVVDVLVDLLVVTVLLEETTQNASAADGEHLGGHTGITGTLLVTSTLVTALALLGLVALNTGAGVHGDLALDNETILEHLADVLAGVGELDLVALVRVHPDAVLTTAEDSRGHLSLASKHNHFA